MVGPASSSHAVRVTHLGKVFSSRSGETEALHDVTLDIASGEFLCVVGPSGCGKTTLLNILGGLEEPTTGNVEFQTNQSAQPAVSVIFQEQGVFPWMTVLDNAAYGLRVRGVGKAERLRTAVGVLETVGLAGFERHYPTQLSGGMRQRVNIARAFANDPQMLLMDEPFASLDEQTKLLLQDDLLHVWETSRKTVMFITHSVEEAIRLADRIIVMTARPGRIKSEIAVSIPRPRDVFELQTNEDFLRIREQVWRSLKEEVLASRSVAV